MFPNNIVLPAETNQEEGDVVRFFFWFFPSSRESTDRRESANKRFSRGFTKISLRRFCVLNFCSAFLCCFLFYGAVTPRNLHGALDSIVTPVPAPFPPRF